MMRIHVCSLALVLACSVSSTAFAATTCIFNTVGSSLRLTNHCETDATLTIPEGMTLDGRGRRITAIDPPAGHFVGAVVRNAGTHAHVRHLTIDTRGLANVCDSMSPTDQVLRGILFEGASGSIVGTRVLGINQGESGCQEGNGIEVRNAPYDGEHPNTQHVSIVGNHVAAYQKTGILVNGDVEAQVIANRVVGLGPVDFIAQNGIQIGFGAYGSVRANRVEQNLYTLASAASSGILLLEAGDQIDVQLNSIDDCDIGIRLVSTSAAEVRGNRVGNSTYDGITLDGLGGIAQSNFVTANLLEDNAVGIDVLGDGAVMNEIDRNVLRDQTVVGIQVALGAHQNALLRNTLRGSGQYGVWVGTNENTLLSNQVRRTTGIGMHVEGEANVVQRNVVLSSDVLDIENVGANAYARNRCNSSTGAPVDCPTP